MRNPFRSWFRKTPALTGPEPSNESRPYYEPPRRAVAGTARSSGILSTDDRLSPDEFVRKGRRILRTTRIGAASMAFRSQVSRLEWEHEPGDRQSDKAREYVEYMDRLCGIGPRYAAPLMNHSWSQHVAEMAHLIDYGWMDAEAGTLRKEGGIVHVRGLKTVDGDGLSSTPWVENKTDRIIVQRAPTGLFSVEIEPGDLMQINQQDSSGKSGHLMPYRALHARLITTGANWDGGMGALRACIPWYDIVDTAILSLRILVDRHGTGALRVIEDRARGREMGYSDEEISRTTEHLMNIAAAYRGDEQATFAEVAGVRLDMFEGPLDALSRALLGVIDKAIGQMLAAYAAGQMALSEGSGSYNSGTVMERSHIAMVTHVANQIRDTHNGYGPFQGALRRGLVDTYGIIPRSLTPMLKHRGGREPIWRDVAPLLAAFFQAGMDQRMPETFSRILEDSGLPSYELRQLSEEINRRTDEGERSLNSADIAKPVDLGPPPSVGLAQSLLATQRGE